MIPRTRIAVAAVVLCLAGLVGGCSGKNPGGGLGATTPVTATPTTPTALDAASAGVGEGMAVQRRWVLPAPYATNGIAADNSGGLWISEGTPSTVKVPSGAIGHLDQRGQLSTYPLPPTLTPGQIVADPDGTQWYTLTEGDPYSTNSRHGIGWRGSDGSLRQVWFPAGEWADSIAIDAGRGLWFVVSNNGDKPYGHLDANATMVEYTVTGLDNQLANTIVAGPTGTVWLNVLQGGGANHCEILQVEVSSGHVLQRFALGAAAGPVQYLNNCDALAAEPDGAVAAPAPPQVAIAHPDGRLDLHPVPGFAVATTDTLSLARMRAVSVDTDGTWLLAADNDTSVANTYLYRLDAHGTVRAFHPIASNGFPPWVDANGVDRNTRSQYDTSAWYISAIGPVIWLAVNLTVFQVTPS
jgi:hypothetical protein